MLRYLVLAGLFFALSPGNFFTLHRGGSKRTVAMVHALAFVVAYYLSVKVAEMLMVDLDEGFKSLEGEMVAAPTFTPIFLGASTITHTSTDPVINNYYEAIKYCHGVRLQKDQLYEKSGDNSAFFRYLDQVQGETCDMATYYMDRARNMGRTFTPLSYNDYKILVQNGSINHQKRDVPVGMVDPETGSMRGSKPIKLNPTGSTGSMWGSTGSMGGSTGSMGGSKPIKIKPPMGSTGSMGGSTGSTKPDAIRVADMFGRGYCVNPYDCLRGTGWTRGLSTCKCLNNKPPLAVFRDASIPAQVMQYVKYK